MQTGQTPVRSSTELYNAFRADFLRADRVQMTDGAANVHMQIGVQLVTYRDIGIGFTRTCVDQHGTFEQLFK